MLALQCISSLTELPIHLVYPYRSHVINELDSCLDDRKRLVRKEAVDCAFKW